MNSETVRFGAPDGPPAELVERHAARAEAGAAAPPRVYAAWAAGGFATSVLVNSIGLLHMRFMTDSLGVGAAVAGSLIGATKLYDTAIDPVMGAISDRTRSRWGRRRPYLLVGAAACALSMLMLFNVPRFGSEGALIAYLAVALLLFNTAYTTFRTPYMALPPEITHTFAERSRLMMFSVVGSSMGSLFATTVAPFLLARFGSNRAGHAIVADILALLILLGGIACFAGIGREAPAGSELQRTPIDWRTRWEALLANKPFLTLIGFKTAMFTGLTANLVAIPYFTRHALHLSDAWLGSVFLARTLATLAAQPLWSTLARRVGRRNALMTAGVFEIVCMLSWLLVTPSNATTLLVPLGCIHGVSGGGLFFGLYTMLPDTMDHDRRRSGLRREGVFAGLFVMVEKITAAAAAALFGVLIGLLGYVESRDAAQIVQPDGAVAGIAVALSIVPAVLAALACAILTRYRLADRDDGPLPQGDGS